MNAVQARLFGMHTDQRLALAKERHLAGDLAAARSLYESVLADEPAHDDALFRLAVLDLQEARYEASLARLDRAV
jgi:protein O-GlcNAc transferase